MTPFLYSVVHRHSGAHRHLDKGRAIDVLLEKGAKIGDTLPSGETSFHIACKKESLSYVLSLLKHKADCNVVDNKGNTPLHLQVGKWGGNVQIAKALIEAGANVRARNDEGKTPLEIACFQEWRSNPEVIGVLAQVGVDPDEVTALAFRVINSGDFSNYEDSQIKVLSTLFGNGADVKATSGRYNRTLLHHLCEKHSWGWWDEKRPIRRKGIADLIHRGAEVNVRDSQGNTPLLLMHLYSDSDWGSVQTLLDAGADIHAVNDRGVNFLHRAASIYQPGIAMKVIDRGVDVNIRDKDGHTPLHWAYQNGCCRDFMIGKLLEKGADADARDVHGRTALFWRLEKGLLQYSQETKTLVNAGMDINCRDPEGRTALHVACQRGRLDESLDILLDCGVEINAVDNQQRTALHFVAEHKDILAKQAAITLLSKDADPNLQNAAGQTPLHVACQKGKRLLAQALVQRGARLNIKDHEGRTPLDLAAGDLKRMLTSE